MDTLVAQQLSQMFRPSSRNGLALDHMALDFSDTDTLSAGAGANFASDSGDNFDALLSKIDAEMINMQSKRGPADSKHKRKPSKMERAMLSEQGVVFDTGDETNSEMKTTLEDLARLADLRSRVVDNHKPTDVNDMGLSSASVREDAIEDAHPPSTVEKGKAKTIKESGADRSRRSSECSSIAQHVNIRFQQMMSDFDDEGSMRNFKQEDQTDLESIQTEELELEFRKTLISQDGPVLSVNSIQRRLQPAPLLSSSRSMQQKRASSTSETDSIATENFDNRFQALLNSKNVREAAVDKFPTRKGTGAIGSYGTQGNFLGDGDDEDDEQQDALSRQSMTDNRYQELNQHSSTNRFAQRPELSHHKEVNSASWLHKAENAVDNRADSPCNALIHSRTPSISSTAPNVVSCGVPKNVSNVTTDQDFSEDDKTLDAESSRILMDRQNQKPLQSQRIVERQHLQNSVRTKPVKAFPPESNFQLQNKIDFEVSIKLQDELNNLKSQIKHCIQAKQDLQKEISLHQDMALKYQEEIKVIEHQVKDSRVKAEDARTSLMLMEFKRESVQKQLQQLTQEVDEKEHRIQELESSRKKLQEMGFTTDEVTNIISEREELREKLKLLESSVGDHSSAEQNLASFKESIIAEKKKFREMLNGLQRDLELKQTTINELNTDRDELMHKLKQFEKRCQDVEREKNDFIKNRSQESCSAEMQMKVEFSKIRDHAVNLQQCLDEAMEQLQVVKLENSRKDEHNNQFREQLKMLKEELNKERELRDSLVEENMKSLKAVIMEKDLALETAIADGKAKFTEKCEQEQDDLQKVEKHYSDQIAEMQEQLTNRDLQLEALTDRLKQQETWVNQLSKRIQEDTYLKYRHLLEEERAKLESDKEAAISLKLQSLHDEMERTVRQMNEDLNYERTQSQNYHKQIFALQAELEETKYQCQQATRDKMEMVTKMESKEQDKERQLAIMKETLVLEMQRAVDKLQDTVRHQEEELERLRKELKELKLKDQVQLSEAEEFEQSVLDELNQEYQANVQLLKAGPSRLTNRTCYAWSPVKLNSRGLGTHSALTTTVETLKTVCNEVRKEVVQLRAEVEKYECTMTKIDRERHEELEALKVKMQSEKLQALETLKERLIHDHTDDLVHLQKSAGNELRQRELEFQGLLQNMNKWKAEMSEKWATKYQDHLSQEIEKRMKEQRKQQQEWDQKRSTIGQSSGPGVYGSPVRVTRSGSMASDESARTVAQLHAKVKQLQLENLTLQRSTNLSSSVPNLSVMSDVAGRHTDKVTDSLLDREESLRVRELELCLQRAESKAKLADERASRNEQLFNQKLREHSKVQETMTQQTKELMQLQRAYSQLHNQCSSPTKSVMNRSTLKTSS